MYTSFFGLNEKPFAITPDPRYLFMSERHGEALAHLVYGVTESGGFMQLTGEVGTGKTTLVRTLLQNKLPNNADVAVVLNPRLSVVEFLETICEELGILAPENRGSVKALVDTLNQQLLKAHAEGRRVILVVDEAQNLSRDVLEQVRLLTNLETAKQKLLQIILIGQPELRDLLSRDGAHREGRTRSDDVARQPKAGRVRPRDVCSVAARRARSSCRARWSSPVAFAMRPTVTTSKRPAAAPAVSWGRRLASTSHPIAGTMPARARRCRERNNRAGLRYPCLPKSPW